MAREGRRGVDMTHVTDTSDRESHPAHPERRRMRDGMPRAWRSGHEPDQDSSRIRVKSGRFASRNRPGNTGPALA